MVQQPPRLEVASGPFKHLGPGVQLRLWLWIAVTRASNEDPQGLYYITERAPVWAFSSWPLLSASTFK